MTIYTAVIKGNTHPVDTVRRSLSPPRDDAGIEPTTSLPSRPHPFRPFFGAGVGHLLRPSSLDTATEATLHSGWPTNALQTVPLPISDSYSPQKKPTRIVYQGLGIDIPPRRDLPKRQSEPRPSSSSCLVAPSSGQRPSITSQYSSLHLLSESRNEPLIEVRVQRFRQIYPSLLRHHFRVKGQWF